jgi:MFS superfamily sulfate permease-like transporter
MSSGSQLSVSGPAAGLTAIVATSIGRLEIYEIFLLAVVIGGVFQLIFGFLKAGILGDYVPYSVIKGMLAAIGLILILKQIPHLMGYNLNFPGDETFSQKDGENTFTEIILSVQHAVPLALIIGVVSILIQILWDKVLAKNIRHSNLSLLRSLLFLRRWEYMNILKSVILPSLTGCASREYSCSSVSK